MLYLLKVTTGSHKVAIIKDGRLVAAGDMESVKGDASLERVFLDLEDDE